MPRSSPMRSTASATNGRRSDCSSTTRWWRASSRRRCMRGESSAAARSAWTHCQEHRQSLSMAKLTGRCLLQPVTQMPPRASVLEQVVPVVLSEVGSPHSGKMCLGSTTRKRLQSTAPSSSSSQDVQPRSMRSCSASRSIFWSCCRGRATSGGSARSATTRSGNSAPSTWRTVRLVTIVTRTLSRARPLRGMQRHCTKIFKMPSTKPSLMGVRSTRSGKRCDTQLCSKPSGRGSRKS
mmetsp:Transcript_64875/g.154915  ORF Transcript_64875/g.154915 Transcript_64875/m.154915 type:complete len:237 (+) Transcript_64875:1915-2625(+)